MSLHTSEIAKRLADIRRLVPGDGVFVPLAEAFDRAAATIDKPMQLAIIGKISSSKSTLVNAILGKEELLPTGQKEVTFNVCWLKYGDPRADVVIHHKDGSPERRVPRAQLDALATIEGGNLDNISYIEIFDDSEILRSINIIDTPGLDALRNKDSQNTLDFIAHVRPDAVIMLFTHSVSDNVLDIVRQFNAGSAFSPLNALGVLTKIDVLWQETIPRVKSALEISKKTVKGLTKRNPMLKKTIFEMYPVSALMFLATTTLTQGMLTDIRTAYLADTQAFDKSLVKVDSFLNNEASGLAPERRRKLVDTLGLYGIAVVRDAVKADPEVHLDTVREILRHESGADAFAKTLYNHFGLRSELIKIEGISQHIRGAIRTVRGRISNPAHSALLAQIDQRVADTFASLAQEHREYELLNAIYNNEIDLDPADAEECCTLFGEHGTSAPQLLGMPSGSTPDQMLARALERENSWRAAIAREPDPDERRWMTVVLGSYTRLRLRIQEMKYTLQLARSFLYNE